MGVGNGNPSETQAAACPTTLMLSYMGPPPQTKLDRAMHEGRSSTYFQNYRNETLSKFSIPPYKWGRRSIPYAPRPDVIATKMLRSLNHNLNVLSNDISTIDIQRMKEVDQLFKAAQIQRIQYKDRTGTLHPLAFFKPDEYKYRCAPGMTTSYFSKYPQNFVQYKLPALLPLTYERQKQTPYIPQLSLSGIYNQSGCIAYKR